MHLHDHYDEINGDRVCRDCQTTFTVFASERRGYIKKGLEIPRRCRECRERRRKERAADAAGYRGPAFWRSA